MSSPRITRREHAFGELRVVLTELGIPPDAEFVTYLASRLTAPGVDLDALASELITAAHGGTQS